MSKTYEEHSLTDPDTISIAASPSFVKKKKKRKKKHHHKHRQHKRDTLHNFDLPGVVRVIISSDIQARLQCVVGDDVTAEHPWVYIKKYLIEENIAFEEVPIEFHSFLPYKSELLAFRGDEFYIGYIPDESREYDEFYLCLTPQAESLVHAQLKLIDEAQQLRLYNAINKTVFPWHSLGSDFEVDENIPRNTRGLYKVVLETKYPIMLPEVRFKERNVQDINDGYVELVVPSRYAIPNLSRKLIHTETQVTPSYCVAEAQTNCGYPINSWTQYEYEYQQVKKFRKEFIDVFVEYFEEHMDTLSDNLYINGNIDLYSNDYIELANRERISLAHRTYREYMSFKDIKGCKDKMISAISWHPMWTGIVALAYSNLSPLWYSTQKVTDDIQEIVHGYNPVLIWSFNDGLTPKLILETYSEVQCLAFCPHDENILVGGCKNGLIVVWDIKNKITKVEEIEILTPAQQKYRLLMTSMMKWMKNTKDLSIVPPAATSELSRKHASTVTSISWVHPLYEINKMGQMQNCSEDDFSMQFLSSSSDGTIMFWDLKQLPCVVPGEYKPVKKSRRLKKRPSALTLDVSPYRALHRKMRPYFQIKVELPHYDKMCPVRYATFLTKPLTYEKVNPEARQNNIADRMFYKVNVEQMQTDMYQELVAATAMGDFIIGEWEGYEYLSGDEITQESLKILNTGRYHDGPIVVISKHPKIQDLYMTVGGKVFAIWKGSLQGRPIMWRRSKYKYTYGEWSVYKSSGLRVNRSDGNREFWNLETRSDTFNFSEAYSGRALLHGSTHPFEMDPNVMGIADDKGTLRLIYVGGDMIKQDVDTSFITKMCENNASRIEEFLYWQETWTEKHAGWIKLQKEEAIAEAARKKEEEEAKRLLEEEQRAAEAAEQAKRALAKLRAPPGQYEEWARENWIVKEQERMGNVLLSMKRLDKETLIIQQAPLKIMEVEEERKKHRQKLQLQKADEIFRTTIAMLFPDLVEQSDDKSKPRYSIDVSDNAKLNYMEAYEEIREQAEEFVTQNPFVFKFNWKHIVDSSKIKKKKMEFCYSKMHRARHEDEKKLRDQGDEESTESVTSNTPVETEGTLEDIDEEVEGSVDS